MPRIIYNGNGNTGGNPPPDNTVYNNGDQITLLGNTGNLVRNADIFAYWNSAANGTGTVSGPGAKLTMGASDITVFAQWYTTAGLTAAGHTTHYQFNYDSVLATAALGNIEPARTNQLIAQCEADFSWMKNLFNNIELPYAYPVSILVANLGGGASWGPPITLKGGNSGKDLLRDLMVAEVTEMFMYQQTFLNLPNHGYGFNGVNDEESNGEGLSHYLNEQFEIRDGRPPGLAFNGALWLNSSLPTGTPGSTRLSGDTPPYDYGARFDYVNNTINDNRNTPASGCSVVFLWYLTVQLGFTAAEICQAASPTLAGVYKNLTGDNGDPFPFFKALLDNRFPSNVAQSIPGTNGDNPFPLCMLSFLVDKSTFGRDEVQDVINTQGGRFQNAFWLVIEGFSADTYLSILPTISAFTGNFANFVGAANFVHSGVYVDYENDANSKAPQRIRLSYDIIFTNAVLNNFPAPGTDAVQMELDTSVTINGAIITGSNTATVFELVGGADPYFTNVNPLQGNEFWLSQDLRVFTVTPGINRSPFGNVGTLPVLNSGNNTSLDTGAGFQYAQNLITYLNANYSNPTGTDPFTLLPGQGTAFSDASSVARYTFNLSNIFNPLFFQNYSFAIARVRLRGAAGSNAQNVKVFFRLWETQTADTNFEGDTYPSTFNGAGHPELPLPGSGNHTIPFFATGNNSAALDYQAGSNINKRLIPINSGDSVWAYFVCYLNLYDSSNIVNGQSVSTNWAVGTHHCMVAEIAYDDAPILNTGIVKNPENSDKLSQRNLQFTYSDNPGIPATHRIPQTFEIKPSLTVFDNLGALVNYPDELMIDWKAVPEGSIANIYWPQVNSADVIDLANKLYATHLLSATDPHTIQCKTTKGVTFVPVPASSGENFAGLFTVDLPLGVTAGQEFNIVVRKVSSRRRVTDIQNQFLKNRTPGVVAVRNETDFGDNNNPVIISTAASRQVKNWRYIAGTFQVRIPVTTKDTMLLPEENILAIMKARLQVMSPANKWYPVLVRYIAYIGARVDGLGGDASSIKPSFEGIVPVKQKEDENCKPMPVQRDKCCRWMVGILGIVLFLMFILTLILILK